MQIRSSNLSFWENSSHQPRYTHDQKKTNYKNLPKWIHQAPLRPQQELKLKK